MGFLDKLIAILRGGPSEHARREDTRPTTGRAARPGKKRGRSYTDKFDTMELSRRLGVPFAELHQVEVAYNEFTIPKRRGGLRRILAPAPTLKALQRKILRRVLGRLRAHEAAMGFERGRSIVTHARLHVDQAVLVRMDIQDFFPNTTADRVQEYFRTIGWDEDAAELLTKLCTHDGRLPQGAPTSPRLSNLVNYGMDVRLAAMAETIGGTYSRYADDITFSLRKDSRYEIGAAIKVTKRVVAEYGYKLHLKQKLSIRRRHQRQAVTGLVVNDGVRLPRETRRKLRAIRHYIATGQNATLTPEQLAGWTALEKMVETQAVEAE